MTQYRRRGLVTAVQWRGDNIEEVRKVLEPQEFKYETSPSGHTLVVYGGQCFVPAVGDWIVRHASFRIRRLEPFAFDALYEPVKETP